MNLKQALLEAFPGHKVTVRKNGTTSLYDCEGSETVLLETTEEVFRLFFADKQTDSLYRKKVINTVQNVAREEGLDVLLEEYGRYVGSTGEHSDAILGWLKAIGNTRHFYSKPLCMWLNVEPDVKRKAIDLSLSGTVTVYHSITSSKEARDLHGFLKRRADAVENSRNEVSGSGNRHFRLFGRKHKVEVRLCMFGQKPRYRVEIYPVSVSGNEEETLFCLGVTVVEDTLEGAVANAKQTIQAFKEKNALRYELSRVQALQAGGL